MDFHEENNYNTIFFPPFQSKSKKTKATLQSLTTSLYLWYKSANHCCFFFFLINEIPVHFAEHWSSKDLLSNYYLFTRITTLNIFHLQTYFKIYLRAHKTQVMLLFFPMGTMFTTPCKEPPLGQMKWGNSGLQNTLKFSLKTVKSQITGSFPLTDSHNVTWNVRLSSSVWSPLQLGGLQVEVFTVPSSTTSGLIHNNDAVTSLHTSACR